MAHNAGPATFEIARRTLSSCGIPHARNGADFFQWRSSKGIVPEKSCRKIGALQFGHRAMATGISFSATSGFCDTSKGAGPRFQARGVASRLHPSSGVWFSPSGADAYSSKNASNNIIGALLQGDQLWCGPTIIFMASLT